MRSTQPAARRIELIAYAAARGLAPAQNSARTVGETSGRRARVGAATSASSVSPTEGNPSFARKI
jgi:hypothetical protein